MKPKKKKIILISISSILLFAGVAAIAYTQRDLPPEIPKYLAEKELNKARKAKGSKYTKQQIIKAEISYRKGLSLMEEESVRIFFLRNFDASEYLFEQAKKFAEESIQTGTQTYDSLKMQATVKLENGKNILKNLKKLNENLVYPPSRAYKLKRAEIALNESEIYHRNEDFNPAVEKAEFAIGQLEDVQDKTVDSVKRYIDTKQIKNWKNLVNEALEDSRKQKTNLIIVDKLDHTLCHYRSGIKITTYRSDLGPNFLHQKISSGDTATPEGKYMIIEKKGLGQSRYHKALLLNYPNQEDRIRFAQLKRKGLISRNAHIGGLIEIHGEGGRGKDWTKGCMALNNNDMDKLYSSVDIGTTVVIVGSVDYNKEFAKLINYD